MKNISYIKEIYLRHTINKPLSGFYQSYINFVITDKLYKIGNLYFKKENHITYIDDDNNMYRYSKTAIREFKYSLILPVNI